MQNPIKFDLNPFFDPRNQRAIVFFLLLLPTGCGEVTATMPTPRDVPVVAIGTNHDPAACGRISGTVTWTGKEMSFQLLKIHLVNNPGSVPNPHQPNIDPTNNRLLNAVVFLKGVDPSRSKPWETERVIADVFDKGILFRDGLPVSFVRHGQTFQIRNEGTVPHVVRGRGAMAFAAPLPEMGDTATRTAARPGIVHLTSGSNVAPASAYLFVCEHPYYTVTKEGGLFTFDAVPVGEYELVVWHPNWQIVGHDRNPETGLICRYRYGEPLEIAVSVKAIANEHTDVKIDVP